MRTTAIALAGALTMLASNAVAQTSPAAAIVAGTVDPNVLRAGTPILLKTSEALTTNGKKLKAGQRVQLEVAENVTLNNVTVIPAGSPATGEVTDVRNKGMWGKSGHINARLLFVRVNGRQLRLTGTFDDKGTTGTAGVVAAVAFVPVAGFFVTGTSANIAAGAPVKGFLDEDIAVQFAGTAPAPMVVAPAPAPVQAVAPAPAPATAKPMTISATK